MISLLLRRWAARRLAAEPAAPRLPGSAAITAPGLDPDRVLLIGGGPAAGSGAVDHDLALAGRLARALRERTGRGAVVEARGERLARLDDLPGLVGQTRLDRIDAAVVFVGVHDAAAGVTVRQWERGLARLLTAVDARGAEDLRVLVMRIPPASALPVYAGPMALLADRRVARLNRATRDALRTRPDVVLTALPAGAMQGRPGSAAWYEQYGAVLAGLLAPALDHRAAAVPAH